MSTKLKFIFVTVLCIYIPAYSKSSCLSYEQKTVDLSGVLSLEVFPGRPNYESVADGDEPEYAWILTLDNHVCVDESDELNVKEDNVKEIHLVPDKVTGQKLESFKNKAVAVSGELFHSHTGHHHKPILMSVTNIVAHNK